MRIEFPGIRVKKNLENNIAFELKVVSGPSMKFNQVEDHQVEALFNSSHSGLYYKIGDIQGRRNSQLKKKPFDCFFMSHSESFIVIHFVDYREDFYMYWINVENWMTLRGFNKNVMEKKSIPIDHVIKHSTHYFKIDPELIKRVLKR